MYINCNGRLIDFEIPKVMGILNVTPDSFYDGGRNNNLSQALRHTEKMLRDGATFIDVGGYSSRPGAEDIPQEEELNRLLPVVRRLIEEFPGILISIDSFRSEVARACIEEGAVMINDISGGQLDPNMFSTIADLQVPLILMHMRGNPQNMKDLNQYQDLVQDLILYFSERIALAREAGINDLIIDPGFGFSKNIAQNFELLSKLELMHHLDVPILAALSRKSLIYKSLGTTPDQALNGTSVLNTISLMKGAHLLRVHDVKEAVECVKLLQQLKN